MSDQDAVEKDSPLVMIVGNPTDGFKVFGPFNTYEEAFLWGDQNCNEAWPSWAMELRDPSTVNSKGKKSPSWLEKLGQESD